MNIQDLATRVIAGERRALAQAITLVESGRADHRQQSVDLLEELASSNRQALRIGLSGTPGVGKSTFIETFGMFLIEQGMKVAVLAVDPSSARSGGSILGDKTRMEHLSREKNAFIRPSPSQSQLGGVARRTREAVTLCEAAGFDIVLIETVGVGQSETMVAEMSDLFLLLLAPAGGDELQGVKRGIMEIADLILINKADGDLKQAALRTRADYSGALRLLRKRVYDPEGFPKAMTVSAITKDGLPAAWQAMRELIDWRRDHGHWDKRRAQQARHWFEEDVRIGLLSALDQADIKSRIETLGKQVAAGQISATRAAEDILTHLRPPPNA
ncbi:methylmalonyl Co-A mutase-associated GTPase MeaB [Aliiroseovarius sediminis]|uniref:methylmalonyl Co-A mutase-associated GTPase MeaB n=1 Tax=Aliiroseovarius sediminis TaxID=2925839 RepID=UPI001F56E61B|nr:methylmalonyl Co-A mutase-associated GTPase MeaB [Aliiroseovarius sediminis]MCI2395351.1 methylmalonyl Co-A mutase-associated GTPase MeaB [Aliiroseovarius sediminis]